MAPVSNRDITLDLIRVLALFFVVIVHTHTGALSYDSASAVLSTSIFFLAKLGVPLFVMISGALLLSKQATHHSFYSRRINKIMLPWIFWSAAVLFFKYYSATIVESGIVTLLKEFIVIMLSDFWFMPMIAGIYLLQPYLQKMLTSSNLYILLGAWFITTSVIPSLYLSPLFPGSASAGLLTLCLSFSGYYMLGWYTKKYFLNIKVYWLLLIFFLAVMIYLIGLAIYKDTSNQLFFITQDYFSPAIVLGSFSVFVFLHKITPSEISRYIPNLAHLLSKMSYGVFLSHVLLLQVFMFIFPNFISQSTDIFSWLIRAILLYSTSTAVITVLYQVPIMRKVIT